MRARRGKDPDYTVGALFRIVDGVLFVVDVVRFRGIPQKNGSKIRQTAEMDGLGVDSYMEQESGSVGVNYIDNYSRHVLVGYCFYGIRALVVRSCVLVPYVLLLKWGLSSWLEVLGMKLFLMS